MNDEQIIENLYAIAEKAVNIDSVEVAAREDVRKGLRVFEERKGYSNQVYEAVRSLDINKENEARAIAGELEDRATEHFLSSEKKMETIDKTTDEIAEKMVETIPAVEQRLKESLEAVKNHKNLKSLALVGVLTGVAGLCPMTLMIVDGITKPKEDTPYVREYNGNVYHFDFKGSDEKWYAEKDVTSPTGARILIKGANLGTPVDFYVPVPTEKTNELSEILKTASENSYNKKERNDSLISPKDAAKVIEAISNMDNEGSVISLSDITTAMDEVKKGKTIDEIINYKK